MIDDMIKITVEQANEILHSMRWKLIKQDYRPSELEQITIKYLQDEVNKFSSNNCVSSSLPDCEECKKSAGGVCEKHY